MAVALSQIAALAKTHPSTVSLVLNGKHYNRVSAETRERIERIARELGYRPNRHAQGLVRGATKTAAILLNRLTNPFFSQYVSLLEHEIERLEYHLIPFETRADVGRERELMSLHRQGVCDLVLSLAHYGKLDEDVVADQSAVVRIDDWDGRASMHCPLSHVAVNYGHATSQLISHLVEAGRRTLGLVLHRGNEPFPQRKIESRYAVALRRTLSNSSLICGESLQISVHESDDLQHWHDAAYSLLSRNAKIDAMLVHTTEQIAPVIEAARKHGRRIGQDLALATFDDPPFAAWIEGGITVIREPVAEVATALAERVVATLKGEKVPPNITIDADLIVRASTPSK